MSISLDSNLMAIRALNNSKTINANIENSIKRLSSGVKLSNAEDDASSMAIASSLNNQSSSLKEAIKNANDGIGVMQIADGGLGRQIDILAKIRVKAISAANNVHSKTSVEALQQEVLKLMDEINHIANTTTYNGISILGGGFINKDFHVGTTDKSFVRLSIKESTSPNLGIVRYETGSQITASSTVRLRVVGINGKSWLLDDVVISTSATTGINNLVDMINKNRDTLGLRAKASVVSTSKESLKNGIVEGLSINNTYLGNVDITGSQGKEALIKTINSMEHQTGVHSSLDIRGHLVITSVDGRGIKITAQKNGELLGLDNIGAKSGHQNYGRITFSQTNKPEDIIISGVNFTAIGFNGTSEAESKINLNNIRKNFTVAQACAMGAYANPYSKNLERDKSTNSIQAGLLTTLGAQALIDSVDIALKNLEDIRSEVAAVQNKLQLTVDNAINLNNNILSSKSQLLDTNYAEETTALNINKTLLQANIFSLSKSKSIRDLILELLR